MRGASSPFSALCDSLCQRTRKNTTGGWRVARWLADPTPLSSSRSSASGRHAARSSSTLRMCLRIRQTRQTLIHLLAVVCQTVNLAQVQIRSHPVHPTCSRTTPTHAHGPHRLGPAVHGQSHPVRARMWSWLTRHVRPALVQWQVHHARSDVNLTLRFRCCPAMIATTAKWWSTLSPATMRASRLMRANTKTTTRTSN